MKNILIADAGSSKTDWSLLSDANDNILRIKTKGINPALQSYTDLRDIISSVRSQIGPVTLTNIYFYGAGCVSTHQKKLIRMALMESWHDSSMEIESDMIGAAKALFGDNSGIACILGTGSNTCLYEESKIKRQIPSLGYVLGDEGSGVALGKRLLNAVFKQQLSDDLIENFQNEYKLSVAELIKKVYKMPMPSAFLASFSMFIQKNIQHGEIKDLVTAEFDSFFDKNIKPYGATDSYPLGFVGSIAYTYANELKNSASKFGVQIEKILKEPISSLESYFLNK